MATSQIVRKTEFEQAVSSWLDGNADQFIKHWLRPTCTLLAYARQSLSGNTQLDASDRAALQKLLDSAPHPNIKTLYQADDDRNDGLDTEPGVVDLAGRAWSQLKALVHAVLAADHLKRQLVARSGGNLADFHDSVLPCIASCQEAWPCSAEPLVGPNPYARAGDSHLARALHEIYGQAGVTTCGFLACRRLLEFLLADRLEVSSPVFATSATVLLYDPFLQKGSTHRLTIETLQEGASGFYLDPVALGLTVIDQSMIESLKLAWSLCQDGLSQQVAHDPALTALAIRLSLDLQSTGGPAYPVLEGESAGVVVACGIFAAARKRRLDLRATASAALDASQPGSLCGVGLASIHPKLKAAADDGLLRVVLEAKQQQDFPAHGRVSILPAGTLDKAFELLTTEARNEEILLAYEETQLRGWQNACRDRTDPDKLTHYVEPHYAVMAESSRPFDMVSRFGTGAEDDQPPSNPYERVPGEGEYGLVNLIRLINEPRCRRLCLCEDAGAGKSIFTRRLQAFLCDPVKRPLVDETYPLLVVRWESDWPVDIKHGLIDELQNSCGYQFRDSDFTKVVEWALRENRVWLIFDALDQFTGAASNGANAEVKFRDLTAFLDSAVGQRCRVVMTSRWFEVPRTKETLFRRVARALFLNQAPHWRFARIEGFDEPQQAEYLRGLYQDSLDELIPKPQREQVSDLLRIPVVLRMIRDLAENGRLPDFRNRGDLYLQASFGMIDRAARKQNSSFMGSDVPRLEQILAASAFEMMLQGKFGFVVRGCDVVKKVREQAGARCAAKETEWATVKAATDLTDRCILEGFSDEILSWQHRGMMEFYCGLHLARHASPQCVAAAAPLANDEQWSWAWRFAIEMPAAARDAERLAASLAPLYARPASGRRPIELIWRSWDVMQGTQSGRATIAQFQSEYAVLIERDATGLSETGVGLRIEFQQIPNRDYMMARYQITNAQYELFDASYERCRESPEDECPVVNVTWYDAWVFSRWCGPHCRLPTEEEWEYACRAGSPDDYCFGNDNAQLGAYAWHGAYPFHDANAEGHTHPVGRKTPNAWGLYDMHGNVCEWCDSWFTESATGRVFRGGSWSRSAGYCRSAYRSRRTPGFRDFNLGFRVAAVPRSQE